MITPQAQKAFISGKSVAELAGLREAVERWKHQADQAANRCGYLFWFSLAAAVAFIYLSGSSMAPLALLIPAVLAVATVSQGRRAGRAIDLMRWIDEEIKAQQQP